MCAAEVDRHVAQRYWLKRRLGKGAYGIVWKAVDRRTGEVVAIKKIFDAFRDKTDAQRTFREIVLLQELGDHPNIIRLLDVIPAENDRDIYLVFEPMDTDLSAVIGKGRLLQDVHKRFITYQLLRATKFIHSGGIIHRDQKPSNILLDASCLVKLCDFGLARPLGGLREGPEGPALTDYVATRWYRAPELLLSSSWYTPGVDMWSVGCVLGEMLCGRPLFPGTSTLHQLQLILKTIPPPSEEDSCSPAERSLHETSWLSAQATAPGSCPAWGPGHGRRWTPSCHQKHPWRPWISSRDSWYLPQTSGLAPRRHCSTPTCRGSIALPESGQWIRLCGSRCWKELSSRPPSIAAASIRRSWSAGATAMSRERKAWEARRRGRSPVSRGPLRPRPHPEPSLSCPRAPCHRGPDADLRAAWVTRPRPTPQTFPAEPRTFPRRARRPWSSPALQGVSGRRKGPLGRRQRPPRHPCR
ncbi:mitogen-activated protein kinase 15 isoform X2 [Suricata suricatta]|uniref:mitogen-activated protein kinase 15 isoform X2 n=1 Tax=Suricata suricatta TaxID=37032 RepID=UPI0011555BE7|nr:mitogen-activated protein kinase 15 isoform X2 [Suricata suricatta]